MLGTRAAVNQLKTLSNRKAGKEGDYADPLADILFRVVFRLRFRRRGELHVESVRNFLSILLAGCGERLSIRALLQQKGGRETIFSWNCCQSLGLHLFFS